MKGNMNFKVKNDTFLRALLREPTEYTPVWMMRQAGRYLPEYCATRKQAGSFLELCKNPNLATEVTLQPLERFPLDAAILFSDILTVPDAMGLGLYFTEGEGPKFSNPLRDEAAIKALRMPDIDKDLRYVTDAVSQIRKALDSRVPLIGFSGSPWTLACYMVEGGSSSDYARVKTLMYKAPPHESKIITACAPASICAFRYCVTAAAVTAKIWCISLGSLYISVFTRAYSELLPPSTI